MRLSYFTKYDGEMKTLQLTKSPFYYGTGYYDDINGVRWDINGVYGGDKPYVTARLVSNIPYYRTDSESNQFGYHVWKPYYFEIIKK